MQTVITTFLNHYNLDFSEPGLIHLKRIATAFSHLPYENVTKILKDAGSTSVCEKLRGAEEVLQDHLQWNTGGTCFSLCNTLQFILKNSGFDSFIAMADMHYGENIHCGVVVSLPEGRFLVDPGYLLHDPMRLPDAGNEFFLKTRMNMAILKNEDTDVYSLSTLECGQRKWRYRLRAIPISDEEFEAHWIHSFSLNSMEHLMMSRLSEQGRIYFRKNRLEKVTQFDRIKVAFEDSQAAELSSTFGVPRDLIMRARSALLSRPQSRNSILSVS